MRSRVMRTSLPDGESLCQIAAALGASRVTSALRFDSWHEVLDALSARTSSSCAGTGPGTSLPRRSPEATRPVSNPAS
jgi:hypothetical protein